MKKSARVSEKLVSPGLPGSQVATRLSFISNLAIQTLESPILVAEQIKACNHKWHEEI